MRSLASAFERSVDQEDVRSLRDAVSVTAQWVFYAGIMVYQTHQCMHSSQAERARRWRKLLMRLPDEVSHGKFCADITLDVYISSPRSQAVTRTSIRGKRRNLVSSKKTGRQTKHFMWVKNTGKWMNAESGSDDDGNEKESSERWKKPRNIMSGTSRTRSGKLAIAPRRCAKYVNKSAKRRRWRSIVTITWRSLLL